MSTVSTASNVAPTYSVAPMRLSSPKAISGDVAAPVSAFFPTSQSSLPTGALAVCKQINGTYVIEPMRMDDILRYDYSEPVPVKPEEQTESNTTAKPKPSKSKARPKPSPKKAKPSDTDAKSSEGLVQCRLCHKQMAKDSLQNKCTHRLV